jgi:signal transduction histidine kinase
MLQVREEYRREFLGNVSHELKTPLFTVQDIYPLCWTGQWMIK